MKEIYKKIHDLKGHLGKVSKEATNPFFKSKYMDLPTLLEHIEPLLQERGLILLQPISDGNVYSIISDIETEEEVNSCIKLPELTDPQKIGSCITYYRRYTLKSLLAIQEQEDDGNLAAQPDIIYLTKEQLDKALMSNKAGIIATINKYSTATHKMKKEFKDQLELTLKELGQ